VIPVDGAEERRESVARDISLGTEFQKILSCRNAIALSAAHESNTEKIVGELAIFAREGDDVVEGFNVVIFDSAKESWLEALVALACYAGAGTGHNGRLGGYIGGSLLLAFCFLPI
jgi:hypothetical protein